MGCVYRTAIAVYGGKSFVPVRKELREMAGVAPGETLTVTVEWDEEPRLVDVPDEFARALDADPEARAIFDRLSHTHRKEYVAWIVEAKRAETRRRRIQRALTMRPARREASVSCRQSAGCAGPPPYGCLRARVS